MADGGASPQVTEAAPNVDRPFGQIALIMPHLSDYTSRIIAAAEAEVRKHGCDLILK